MKRGIHLYIDGKEIEFASDPQILFNYAVSDIASPAVVKNSYSKTLDIPATKNNTRVFNSVWKLDATGFDPGRKIPFSIYVDDELYETGYCRLDRFVKKWNQTVATVTFFGGLGEFMYNLAYSPDDPNGIAKKKTLADLVYRYDGEGSEEVDLDFRINMDTVYDAWLNIGAWNSKWRFLNFAPAYNGLPDDFDSDKVAVYGIHTEEHQEDGKTYRPYQGWAIDELPRNYTGAEMREFRSYLQRVCIRTMEVIKACCLPENNGGYKVNLDPTWFVHTNPYWQWSYVTLPMLSSLDYTSVTPEPSGSLTFGVTTRGSGRSERVDEYWENSEVSVTGLPADANYNLKATLKLKANVTGTTASQLFPTANQSNPWLRQRERFGYNGAVVVQLVAYDSFGNAIAGSTPQWLRSPYWGYDQYTEPISLIGWGFNFVYPSESLDVSNGCFERVNGEYVWSNDLVLKLNDVPPGSTLKIVTYKIANYGMGSNYSGGTPVMHLWQVDRHGTDDYYDWTWQWHDMTTFGWSVEGVDIDRRTSDSVRSGALIEKSTLLATSYTPADFLASYCKLFGLVFRKDPAKKEIDILSRGSFYNGGTMDINDLIDRDSIEVTPSAFDKHWYDFTPEESESEYGNDYLKQYGEHYGSQTVNTGYQFNSETEQVFKDNIFKGSVEALERSDAFCVVPDHERELIYKYKGYNYLLYNIHDVTDSYEVEVPKGSTVDLVTGIGDNLYYDLFSKVQLHTADNSPADGDCVLLLYRGNQSLVSGNKSLGYRITDDNGWMTYLNSNVPAWLLASDDYDADGNHLMISVEECPSFGRFIHYGTSGFITQSLDFGEPKTLYVPGLVSKPEGTLYAQCWENYISDLYSPDTRVVQCNVCWKGRLNIDDLRRFYWFDGCYWRIDKVEDWDMLSRGLTKMTFVKVNDLANYAVTAPSEDPSIKITLSSEQVPLEGGTINFSVETSDGGSWYVGNYDPDVYTIVPDSAQTSASGTITVPAYYDSDYREIPIQFVAGPVRKVVTIVQSRFVGSVEYLGTSYPGGSNMDVIPDTGGNAYFRVVANTNWSLYINGNFGCSVSPSTGTATQGTVVTATIPANTSPASNTIKVGFSGISQNIFASATQNGAGNPYLVCSSSVEAPAGGGNVSIRVHDTNVNWETVCYEWITASPNSGGAGSTNITLTVAPNTTGSRRVGQVSFYLAGYNQSLATCFVYQDPQ